MPSYLKLKWGVETLPVVVIAAAAINASNELGILTPTTITSGKDGQHVPDSKHYTHEALDFRTKHLSRTKKREWMNVLRRRLGPSYDVILEDEGQDNEHAHVERQQYPLPAAE